MLFDIDFYHGNYGMYCSTEEMAKDFLKYLDSTGRQWATMRSYLDVTHWEKFTKGIVYYFNEGTYSDPAWEKCQDYIILNWADFIDEKNCKSLLRDGMVVEDNEGSLRVVVGDKLLSINGSCLLLSKYRENLKTFYTSPIFDIQKIYKFQLKDSSKDYFCLDNLKLIWKRKSIEEMTFEEIEEALDYSIKSIKEGAEE